MRRKGILIVILILLLNTIVYGENLPSVTNKSELDLVAQGAI